MRRRERELKVVNGHPAAVGFLKGPSGGAGHPGAGGGVCVCVCPASPRRCPGAGGRGCWGPSCGCGGSPVQHRPAAPPGGGTPASLGLSCHLAFRAKQKRNLALISQNGGV